MVLNRSIQSVVALIGLTAGTAAAELPTISQMQNVPTLKREVWGIDQKLTPESQLLSPEDRAARRKLSAFITCLNGVADTIPNLSRPYRDAFRAVSKDPVNGLDHISYNWQYQSKFMLQAQPLGKPPIQECAEGLDAAVTKPPVDEPMDALAKTYAADLRKLEVLAPKVEAYYNGKDFRDDKMAKGREMNAQYEPLLHSLLAEGHEIFVLSRAREAVLVQHRLDAIERLDGKQLRWQANAFMLQARTSLDGLEELVKDKKVTKPAVLALVTPLETRFTEASNYAAAHPEESNDNMNLWAKIADYATELMTAAKQARRDADTPASTGKVSDDTARMAYVFGNIVDYANASKR